MADEELPPDDVSDMIRQALSDELDRLRAKHGTMKPREVQRALILRLRKLMDEHKTKLQHIARKVENEAETTCEVAIAPRLVRYRGDIARAEDDLEETKRRLRSAFEYDVQPHRNKRDAEVAEIRENIAARMSEADAIVKQMVGVIKRDLISAVKVSQRKIGAG